MSNLSRSS